MPRLAHLADCHLGYRQGNRCTSAGINQREFDVAQAFRSAVDGILAAQPDLVCLAGDLFHTPRPSNAAITFAFQQLRRLREAGLPVVQVGGNHDKNKLAESGSILRLFLELGIDLAIDAVQRFEYPALDLTVTAVPDRADLDDVRPGSAKYNVLCIHGQVEGTCPGVPGVIPRSLIEDERWDYVALGDYHIMHRVAERAWYSGSLEWTSSNIWSEVETPKGWLLADLESGDVTPQLVSTRQVLDLPMLDATDLTPEEVNAQLREYLADIAGKLVRIRVVNLPRGVQRELDWKAIRRWQTEATLLRLDFQRPEMASPNVRAFLRRQSVTEMLADRLATRVLPAGMDRSALLSLGASLMSELAEAEPDREKGAA